ncbi:MAG TPA: TonB-dependent receptor, partial [Bryobacteraceae bacterium]|nr:TonB-dependent receptor [Bryobacteraceae bacterium]
TINSQARVDMTLQVGAVSESVLVSASAAQLQTDRAEVRTEITTKALTEIPVAGQRNYQALFITVPGITPPSTPHSIPSNPSRSMQFFTNGTNAAANNTRIDGASATNIWLPHIASYVPALESIDTVNIVTNSFDAEQGLAGGAAVNVQIRSGSNELHGAGFWYHMGSWSQSRPFFLPANQNTPKFVYNQSGGRLGGPIVKNKLFYFGSYERTTDRRFAFRLVNIPSAAMRRGDLSASPTTIYDPATGNPDGTGRTPFPGNIIPENRINPLARRLMSLLPAPNTNLGSITQNFYAGAPFSFDRHTIDTKVNYNVTDKWTAFGRLSWLKFDTLNQTTFGEAIGGPGINSASNPGQGYGGTWTGTLGTTYVLSPTFVIDAYYGYTLMDANVEQPGLGPNTGREDFGIPGTNGTRRFESGMPGFNIDGFESFGSTESFMPYFRRDPQQQWVANFNWTRGSHNLRFGFEVYKLALNHTQPEFTSGGTSSAAGRLNSNRGPTQLSSTNANGAVVTSAASQYNSMGTFLLGLVTDGGRLLQVPDEYTTRTSMFSFYVRDQWQASPKLTVNYGTRYEYFPMPTRSDRGMERYDFATNEMLLCGQGNIPTDCGTKQNRLLFSPRLGVAYRATEKTVFRAGFGINWDPWNLARPLRTNFPILAVQTIQAPNSLSWATTFTQGLPAVPVPDVSRERLPLPVSYAVNTTDDEFTRGYILNWNATVERELPGGFAAQVGYVANRSIKISGVVDLNAGQVLGADRAGQPLVPRFNRSSATNLVDAWSYSTYHSLQTQLKRRFANGVQMNASYTWSKAIGFCCNEDNNGRPRVQALAYLDLNRTVLNFDRTHNFQLTGTFELPFGRGKAFEPGNAVASYIASGWQINTLISLMSGTPFSMTSSNNSLRMPGNDQRADQVKQKVEKLGGVGNGQPYYDPTAFARVTEARFGTAGFNSLRGPGAFNTDLSLFRRFGITEGSNLEFRAEVFNATNTPKFNNPNSNIDNTDAMWITGINTYGRDIGERMIRLGLRFSF